MSGSAIAPIGLHGSVLLAMLCAAGQAAAGDPYITTIIKPGDPVPGMADFVFTGAGGVASINDLGAMLINATIDGPGGTLFNDNVLIHRGVGGAMTVLAREGDPIPGLPGYVYRDGSANTAVFRELMLSPAGDIGVVAGGLTGTTARDVFLTSAPVGPGLTPLVYEGGPAPGFAAGDSVLFLGLPVSMHDNGLSAFAGRVSGSQNEDAVWFGGTAGLTVSLQSGLQAPGQPIGATIGSFNRESLRHNALGEITFGAILDLGNGISQSNRSVLYSGDPANLGVLAQTGNPVPGVPGAAYALIDAESARVNSAGAICFGAQLPGGTTDDIIMTSGSGVTVPLVRNADPIPGLPGLTFNLFDPRLEMNAGAEVLFNTLIFGAPFESDSALCIGSPGSLEIILREGDLVDGHIVGHIGASFLSINDRGDVLVEVGLDGQNALVAIPRGQAPTKLARATEFFSSDDGFVGVFSATNPWSFDRTNGSSQAGDSVVMNSRGQIVMTFGFTGSTGRGLFLIDLDGEPCIADLNGDDSVDFFDISLLLTTQPDLNGDGAFNFLDVTAFISSFQSGCP